MEAMKGEVEVLERLETEALEIKEILYRLEIMLIGEEEITEEEKRELEKRLEEARQGETVTLQEFLRDMNVRN